MTTFQELGRLLSIHGAGYIEYRKTKADRILDIRGDESGLICTRTVPVLTQTNPGEVQGTVVEAPLWSPEEVRAAFRWIDLGPEQ